MEGKVYDLDLILISPRVYQRWVEYAPVAVQDILKELKGMTFDSKKDILEEQFRELADGSGEIFVLVPKISKEIKMKVPKGEWAFNKK